MKDQMDFNKKAKQKSDLDVSSLLNSVANFQPEPPKGPAPGKGVHNGFYLIKKRRRHRQKSDVNAPSSGSARNKVYNILLNMNLPVLFIATQILALFNLYFTVLYETKYCEE